MPRSISSVRLFLICFAAVALALPMAILSLAKLMALLGALILLVGRWVGRRAEPALPTSAVSLMVLLTLTLMLGSALWSTGSNEEILTAMSKHGRLILIPVMLCLIRNRREASLALAFFVGGQLFLLGSTWLLFAGVPVPWVTSKEAGICEICSYAIFSSYLDQSIMTAVLAAVCWHLRPLAPTRYRTALALLVATLALACVFFLFQGRTGHLVAIAMLVLALAWELPQPLRGKALLLTLLLLAGLMAGSSKVTDRFREVRDGVQSFHQRDELPSSTGLRLDLWQRSVQSITDSPWIGTGVGSWNREFKRQEQNHLRDMPINRASSQHHNPHQEYLLWGVELGLAGVVMLCGLMLALYRDSLRLDPPQRRAMQSVVLALCIACLFNCSLYDALIGDFFCITLGLLLRLAAPLDARPALPEMAA